MTSLKFTIYPVLVFFHHINILYGHQRIAGKVYTQQYWVSQRSIPVCFIFFAFLSSAKLRQFHFCWTMCKRPKSPLGTDSLCKGTCERSARLEAGNAEGFPLCQHCAANPSCRDLRWQQGLCRMGLEWGSSHKWHAAASEGQQGMCQEDSLHFWR